MSRTSRCFAGTFSQFGGLEALSGAEGLPYKFHVVYSLLSCRPKLSTAQRYRSARASCKNGIGKLGAKLMAIAGRPIPVVAAQWFTAHNLRGEVAALRVAG